MDEFAVLRAGVFERIEQKISRPPNIPHKEITWHPVVREYGTPFTGLEGDNYVIRTVNPANLPPPVPSAISDRQFFHVLALNGSITQEEALNAVKTGEIPAVFMALVDAIDGEEMKFNAMMLLSGAVEFRRNHPLVAKFGKALGYSSDAVDDLFRAAAQL